MDNPFYDECDVYCEHHAPEDAREIHNWETNETDSPEHCSICRKPLECSLTSEGVQYVIDIVKETLKSGADKYCTRENIELMPEDYYKNAPHYWIVMDWIKMLRWYNLPDSQSQFLQRAGDWMTYQGKKRGIPAY